MGLLNRSSIGRWTACLLVAAVGTTACLGPGAGIALAQQDERSERQRQLDRRRELEAQARERARRMNQQNQQNQAAPLEPGERLPIDEAMADGEIRLDFEGEVSLGAFIDFVSRVLEINIIEDPQVGQDTVLFRAPMSIEEDQLIPLLQTLLRDSGFAMVQDDLGFYRVVPAADLPPDFEPGMLGTTRVFPTPLVRPSTIDKTMKAQLGGLAGALRTTPMDELGLLIVTGPPPALDTVGEIIDQVMAQIRGQGLHMFELENVSAVYARSRLIALNGRIQTQGAATAGPGGGGAPTESGAAPSQEAMASMAPRPGRRNSRRKKRDSSTPVNSMIPYSVISGSRKITARNSVITLGTSCRTMVPPVLSPRRNSGPAPRTTMVAMAAPARRSATQYQRTQNSIPSRPRSRRRRLSTRLARAETPAMNRISAGSTGASPSRRNAASSATRMVLSPSMRKGTRNSSRLASDGSTKRSTARGPRVTVPAVRSVMGGDGPADGVGGEAGAEGDHRPA